MTDWAAAAAAGEPVELIAGSPDSPGLVLEPRERAGAFVLTGTSGDGEPALMAQVSVAVATAGRAPYLLAAIRPVGTGRRLLAAVDVLVASMVEWAGAMGWGLDLTVSDRRLDRIAQRHGLREGDSGVWRLDPADVMPAFPGSIAAPEAVAAALGEATGWAVRPGPGGRLGSMFRRLSLGHDTTVLEVTDDVGRFRVLVPDWTDLSTGRLAPALVEFGRVRSRFPWAGLQVVSFDHSGRAGRRRVSGYAIAGEPSTVHVSPGLIRVQPYDLSATSPSYPPTPRLSGAGQPVPWLVQVLAHESWHRVEFGFEAIDYRASMDFRRELGEQLGLETLEQAWTRTDGSGEVALASIRGAVGDYATTNRHECTAELFTAWWFGATQPLVTGFGELVERYVPRDAARGRQD